MNQGLPLQDLLKEVRQCRLCEAELPLGPRPVVRAAPSARLLIIGQAPGTRVHASGIPWDDASGARLRDWMGLDASVFYDPTRVAIMPMGFCYPGRGRSGDLPPSRHCAPQWHQAILERLPDLQCILLVGQYAQAYYLDDAHSNLTQRVSHWRDCPEPYLPLVHPSPRNRLWLRRNPWFEAELVPALQKKVAEVLGLSGKGLA